MPRRQRRAKPTVGFHLRLSPEMKEWIIDIVENYPELGYDSITDLVLSSLRRYRKYVDEVLRGQRAWEDAEDARGEYTAKEMAEDMQPDLTDTERAGR